MNRVVVPARQSTQAGRIDSLELILGLLKTFKIRALEMCSEKRRKMALSPLPRVSGGAPWLLIPPGGGGIGSDSNVEKKGV